MEVRHTFADKIVMLAELTIKPEKIDAFLDYTVDNLPKSRSYPGNVQFDILVDQTSPLKVVFYEVWDSHEAQQAYMAWRVQTAGGVA